MERRRHILLVVRWPVGGIRSFLRYLYGALGNQAYRLSIAAPGVPELEVLLGQLGSEVRHIDLGSNPTGSQIARRVLSVARSTGFDLIHSQGFIGASCATPAAVVTGTPHLITLHDMISAGQFEGMKGALQRRVLAFVLRRAQAIHFVSNDSMTNVVGHFPCLSPDKLRVARNGIDVRPFRQARRIDLRTTLNLDRNTFLIGFFGRFMSPKGFRYLARALQMLLGRNDLPRRPLVLAVGEESGFIREERDFLRENRLDHAVVFLPFTPDLGSTLKGLDVLAVPSTWETCPLLPMEAMVAGVPVIGTDCVGLREVLAGTPAATVPSRDAPALAEALAREMLHPSKPLAASFIEEATRRFDVRTQATELQNLLDDLVQN